MIVATGLSYRYPRGPVLGFPDLRIAQGQTLILQGPSGCGKSTWLALAAGLLTASQGEIQVAGQSLGALSGAQRDAWRAKNLGFLPQKLHLSQALTVFENLSLTYFAAGVPENRQAIDAALHALGLNNLADKKPAQLSGGQAQRVALARSVLLGPKVILADEPTASLDDAHAKDALQLLQASVARCAATLVIATHDARVTKALPGALCLRLHDVNGANPMPEFMRPL